MIAGIVCYGDVDCSVKSVDNHSVPRIVMMWRLVMNSVEQQHRRCALMICLFDLVTIVHWTVNYFVSTLRTQLLSPSN